MLIADIILIWLKIMSQLSMIFFDECRRMLTTRCCYEDEKKISYIELISLECNGYCKIDGTCQCHEGWIGETCRIGIRLLACANDLESVHINIFLVYKYPTNIFKHCLGDVSLDTQ